MQICLEHDSNVESTLHESLYACIPRLLNTTIFWLPSRKFLGWLFWICVVVYCISVKITPHKHAWKTDSVWLPLLKEPVSIKIPFSLVHFSPSWMGKCFKWVEEAGSCVYHQWYWANGKCSIKQTEKSMTMPFLAEDGLSATQLSRLWRDREAWTILLRPLQKFCGMWEINPECFCCFRHAGEKCSTNRKKWLRDNMKKPLKVAFSSGAGEGVCSLE